MSFIDARQLPQNSTLRGTLVIVGTGPAGANIARELASTGVDIIMLEGGSLEANKEADDTLKANERSQEIEPLEKARTKRLGGASTQWGGRTYPFDVLDFEDRTAENLKFSGWPVSRHDLEPYYRRAAVALDIRSYEWTAAEAIPGDPVHLVGESEIVNSQAIWRWSPPLNFAEVIKKELGSLGNVRVVYNANVTALIQNAETGKIESLQIQSEPGKFLTVVGEQVVVAAGGLETARLLLASGIKDEDQIGRNYMIHPIAELGRLEVAEPESVGHAIEITKSRDGVWVRRLLQLEDKVRREEGLLNLGFAIWYEEPRSPEHGDPLLSAFALARKALTMTGGFKGTGMHRRYAELENPVAHVKNVVTGLPEVAAFGSRWVRDRILDSRTLPMFSRYSKRGIYRIRFDAEQSPNPENRVVLSETEKDAYGVPRLDIQHSVSQEDRLNYLKSLKILAEGLRESGFGIYTPPTEEEILNMKLVDATHQMGLVRMGTSPENSVVDKNLKVWSSPNLHLSTAGVFSTAGMAGPTLTVVALSIRLADHLAQEMGL